MEMELKKIEFLSINNDRTPFVIIYLNCVTIIKYPERTILINIDDFIRTCLYCSNNIDRRLALPGLADRIFMLQIPPVRRPAFSLVSPVNATSMVIRLSKYILINQQ